MTLISEFIQLRPSLEYNQSDSPRKFICELPDIERDDLDTWLDCGRVTVSDENGILSNINIELNDQFLSQYDNEEYDCEEVLNIIAFLNKLWVSVDVRVFTFFNI